jgi:hypothetical protein
MFSKINNVINGVFFCCTKLYKKWNPIENRIFWALYPKTIKNLDLDRLLMEKKIEGTPLRHLHNQIGT